MTLRTGQTVDVYDTFGELDPSEPLGQLALVLDPLSLYVMTATGYQPLASLAGATLPSVGNHNLYSTTHPDVGGTRADGEVLVWRPAQGTSGLYDHEALAALLANASEATAGVAEIATQAETNAGTDDARIVTPAKLAMLAARPGDLKPSARINPDAGWLRADGAAVGRTAYAALFAAVTVATTGNTTNGSSVVGGMGSTAGMEAGMPFEGANIPSGTTIASVDSAAQVTLSASATATVAGVAVRALPYGGGDGSTTFNVPDMRGRAAVGAGAGAGLTARRLGATMGSESHALTIAEMPPHDHQVRRTLRTDLTGGGAQAAVRGVPGDSPDATASSATSTGGGGAHNNVQPSTALNWFVKT